MKSTNHLRHGNRLEFRILMYAFVFGLSLTQSTSDNFVLREVHVHVFPSRARCHVVVVSDHNTTVIYISYHVWYLELLKS